jgi:tRNA uridine 5-carboxymethylaminomethyl modification enzyme
VVSAATQGFIERQQRQLEQVASKHSRALPDDLDYGSISTMSKESREKLTKFRPQNIGQVRESASR